MKLEAHKECLENFSLQQIRNRTLYEHIVTPCKGMQIQESGKFLLVESWILFFGIQNTALGIHPTFDWNPESQFNWQRIQKPTLRILNLWRGIYDCLRFPYTGRTLAQCLYALQNSLEALVPAVCIGNSMICRDIWHKFHEWYFEIAIRNNWDNFEISRVIFVPNITYKSWPYLFILLTAKVNCNFHT